MALPFAILDMPVQALGVLPVAFSIGDITLVNFNSCRSHPHGIAEISHLVYGMDDGDEDKNSHPLIQEYNVSWLPHKVHGCNKGLLPYKWLQPTSSLDVGSISFELLNSSIYKTKRS